MLLNVIAAKDILVFFESVETFKTFKTFLVFEHPNVGRKYNCHPNKNTGRFLEIIK